MREEWRPVRGFEEYAEISNLGQIHRFRREWYTGRSHQIKRIQEETWTYGSETSDGYLQATIGGVCKGVHIWMYLTFVGDIPQGFEVNHMDENKHNNCVWNLNLMTKKENIRWGTGIARRAASRSKAVQALDPKTLEVVYEFPSTQEAQRQGFNSSHISACCLGKRKTHKGYIWRYA